MELFWVFLVIGIIVSLIIFVIRLPIIIAKNRGITGEELSTITILSWVSLIVGITWIVALVLSLVYKPKKWIDKDDKLDLNQLEKLYSLKKKGIISDEEYEKEKQKILDT